MRYVKVKMAVTCQAPIKMCHFFFHCGRAPLLVIALAQAGKLHLLDFCQTFSCLKARNAARKQNVGAVNMQLNLKCTRVGFHWDINGKKIGIWEET